MNLFLIRHGESEANKNKKIYRDVIDRSIKLTNEGCKQAKEAGKFLLRNYEFDNSNTLLFGSSYLRAVETAENINLSLDLRTHLDDRLVELNRGLFTGFSRLELKARYPEEANYFFNQKDLKNKFFTKYPMGESPFDVSIRLNLFLNDKIYNESAKNIIIVAHGLTNLIIEKLVMGYSVDRFENTKVKNNCSIIKIIVDSYGINNIGEIFVPK